MSYMVDTIEFKKKMIEAGFDSFSALADTAGLSRDTVSAIANGKRRPSTNVMDKLIVAMNMTFAEAGTIFLSQSYAIRKYW